MHILQEPSRRFARFQRVRRGVAFDRREATRLLQVHWFFFVVQEFSILSAKNQLYEEAD